MQIYTDISFNSSTRVAVLGFLSNNHFTSKIIYDTTNTEAEIRCIMWAMEFLDPSMHHIIFTDCKTATDLISQPRYNKPIYSDFIKLFADHPNVQLIHLYGHKPSPTRHFHDKQFSLLDEAVRYILRNYLRNYFRNPQLDMNFSNIEIGSVRTTIKKLCNQ